MVQKPTVLASDYCRGLSPETVEQGLNLVSAECAWQLSPSLGFPLHPTAQYSQNPALPFWFQSHICCLSLKANLCDASCSAPTSPPEKQTHSTALFLWAQRMHSRPIFSILWTCSRWFLHQSHTNYCHLTEISQNLDLLMAPLIFQYYICLSLLSLPILTCLFLCNSFLQRI